METLWCTQCDGWVFRVEREFGSLKLTCLKCGRQYSLALSPTRLAFGDIIKAGATPPTR